MLPFDPGDSRFSDTAALIRGIRQPIDELFHFLLIGIEFVHPDQPIIEPNEVITQGTVSYDFYKGMESNSNDDKATEVKSIQYTLTSI